MNPLYEKLIIDFLAKAHIERDATLIIETLKAVYPVLNLPVDKTIKRFIDGETAKPREALLGFMAAYVLAKTQEEVETANGKTEVGVFFQTYRKDYEAVLTEEKKQRIEALTEHERQTIEALAEKEKQLTEALAEKERQVVKAIAEDATFVKNQELALKKRKIERYKTIALWILSGLLLTLIAVGIWFFLKKEPAPVFIVAPLNMIKMPSGTFPLGDTFNDTKDYDDEKPVRQVTIDSFQMSQTEITFDLFDMFCQAKKIPLREDLGWGRSGYPAIMMDWYEAIEFCNWLSVCHNFQPVYTTADNPLNPIKKNVTSNFNANGYRLPTEAEWEYAAAYDATKKRKLRFSGLDIAKSSALNFNTEKQTNEKYIDVESPYNERTVPVMESGDNQNKLYGMTGNVAEWCHDFYHRHFYGDTTHLNNPVGEEIFGKDTSHSHVLRGGHWEEALMQIRASYRESSPANCRSEVFGFRVVRRESKTK